MSDDDRMDKEGRRGGPPKKNARLAEALRANLQRRKAQARSRKEGALPAESGDDTAQRRKGGPENAE